jgi:beta-glucanase (GH16 family)
MTRNTRTRALAAALFFAAAFPLAFKLLATDVVGATGAGATIDEHPTCTFDDGTTVPGTCMEDDNFDTFDTSRWLAENSMVSALLEHGAPWGCVREENVSVSGGELVLTMSDNVRVVPCPQAWPVSANYTSLWAPNFPAPTGTSYDTASVSAKTFKATYGTFEISAKMPAGTSPWGANLMWGENCQDGGAMNSLMEGIFTLTGPCDWPAAGSWEFDIPSYVHSQLDAKQGIFGFHRSSGSGAPLLRSFHGTIPYYGWDAAPAGSTIDPAYHYFVTSTDFGDLSADYHTYRLDWAPGELLFLIDGALAVQVTGAYVPATPMFPQMWNVDNAAVATSLPQSMRIRYYHAWCKPGVPCTWTGGL